MSDVFVKAGDKAKSETFNSVSVLADIFQLEMRMDFPEDYRQSKFPDSSDEYLVGVGKCSIVTNEAVNNNTVLSGTTGNKVIFRVYPNFRLKWLKKIVSEDIGSIVSCRVLDANTQSVLINNVSDGSNLTGYNVGLKELDIEFTFLTSGAFNGFSLFFDSAASKSDIKWTVGLDNIQGLVTELNKKATKLELEAQLNTIYYIGKIEHIAVDKTPAQLGLPGTWEQIKGRFLLGSDGSIYPLGSKAGSSTHTLSSAEMPVHKHSGSISSVSLTTNSSGNHNHAPNIGDAFLTRTVGDQSGGINPASGSSFNYTATSQTAYTGAHTHIINAHSHTLTINNNGSGQAHNNMPPYEVVHIWKRIS